MLAGEPLAPPGHFSEVDTRFHNPLGRRILDPGTPFDLAERAALGAEPKDPSHRVGVTVGHQVALHQVVAGLGAIDPFALVNGAGHSHHHVLGELFPVELGERPKDVVEHPTRRRGEIEALGERVHRHVGLTERVGEQDEVTEVARQPVEPPHQQVRDVTLLHHRQDLLQAGPFQILARRPRLVDHRHRSQLVQRGIGAQLVGLPVDGVALGGLLLGGDPAVGHGQHSDASCRLRRMRRLTATSTDATRS